MKVKNIIYTAKCLNCNLEYNENLYPPYFYELNPKLKQKDLHNSNEYFVALIIQDERRLRGHKCEKCKSEDICVSHISVDGIRLFNPTELNKLDWSNGEFYFTLEITKENSIVTLVPGGNDQIPMLYIWSAIERIKKEIRRRNDKYFTKRPDGYFFIAVSGDFYKCKLERFIAYHIDKEELNSSLNNWMIKQGIATEEDIRDGFI